MQAVLAHLLHQRRTAHVQQLGSMRHHLVGLGQRLLDVGAFEVLEMILEVDAGQRQAAGRRLYRQADGVVWAEPDFLVCRNPSILHC